LSARTLVLVRHGETLWNREGRFQGQTDVPLSDEGRRQARALRERLAAHEHLFDPSRAAVVASDLARAWETAEIAFAVPGRAVHRDPRLREFHYGIFEGLTRAEIEARHADAFAEWRKGLPHYRLQGGESSHDVLVRARAAVHATLARETHPFVVAVVHGGVMRQLVRACIPDGVRPEDVGYENVSAHVMTIDGESMRYGGRL